MEKQLEDMLTELLNLKKRMDDIQMKCLADCRMTLNVPTGSTSSAWPTLSVYKGTIPLL